MERCSDVSRTASCLCTTTCPAISNAQIACIVAYYSHARTTKAWPTSLRPTIYFGRAETILLERERIKRQTIANRRLQHQLHGRKNLNPQMIQSRPSASRQYASQII